MKSFFLVVAYILLAVNKVNCEFTPPQEYVPLIIKIREYFHASTVFTIHHGDLYNDYGDIPMVYIAHTCCRMLSREGIVSLDVHFHRLNRTLRYVGNAVRPLFVVIIGDDDDLHQFSEATRTFKMSFAAWLVLFIQPPKKGKADYCHHPIGNPFHLDFNVEMLVSCSNDNVLREWYSIDGEKTEIFELVLWKKELASPFILLNNHSLYERRRNLRGKVLRGIYVKGSPFFTIQNGKMGGMMGYVIEELMEVMNFTVNIRQVSKYGIIMKNGKWTGAIGELAADRADFGMCEFSMIASRMQVVEYLKPLLVSRNHIYFRQPDAMVVQWFAYFKTFSLWVWSCVIAVILLMTILLTIIHTYSGSTRKVQIVSDSFLSVWGIFCQQGLAEFPRLPSLRVAYFTTFIVAIVVLAAYSGGLISFLTASTRTLPFLTFEEFVYDGHYRLIVIQSTADHELFSQSTEKHSLIAKSLMMPDHVLPRNMEEAFQQICRNPKFVLYTSIEKARAAIYWTPCKLSSVDAGRIDSMSMVLRKGSPYTDIMNHNVLKFMFNGMINRMKGNKLKLQRDQSVSFDPVKMNSVAPILTIFCCGVVLGLVVLLFEKCFFFVKRMMPLKQK